ncbi:hypothetical protein [Pontibacter arcticus]|uniref:Uncharacterized protein n=1 Tax=Pontibacter arcticus TaxID=2080288 RepID=A0A364RCB5_9BACT|nr:hypothetical protein [Pontibacter arcticus]RAU81919.1 hypothetical protein DP923_14625 [Pontibacter arcticus]
MEGNNWYNRTGYTDYRNRADGDERPLDQSVFRGSYRLDNDSQHHNQSTYNRNNQRPDQFNDQHRGNQRHDQDYERDWSSRYHNSRGGFDREDYNDNRNRNYQNQNQYNNQQQRSYNDGRQSRQFSNDLNTNANYGPDSYNNYNRGENYGNMAGSLSYGYDGTSNYNPDWNNRYDPMSGEIGSKHGHYASRRPNFYTDEDRENNPDDFRPLGRL